MKFCKFMCSLAICSLPFFLAAQNCQAELPNILLVTVDNLGFGDLRAFNTESEIRTPEIDRFATQSARLTSFYTASPTCTVSRASLLTGRVPQRHGLLDQLGGVSGNYGIGLPHAELLIAQLLKGAPLPYSTGCFGKWNIGFAEGSRPTERGFDEFIGHASGNCDYYRHNYRQQHDLYNGIAPLHREGEYSTDIFATAASDFISRMQHAGKPWFCYLPFNAPHFPVAANKLDGEPNQWQAPPSAFERYGWDASVKDPRKRYAAVVTALDDAFGRVLNTLDETGASDNTFVFFMSDNGAFRLGRKRLDVGTNTPLRNGGVTLWEGGIRVCAFARWPDRIQPNVEIDEALWSPDIFIACCKLANIESPSNVVLDGRDPLPTLLGESRSPHKSLFFEYRTHQALRMGQWKIVRETHSEPWQLFDVQSDISESHNLSAQYRETQELLEREFLRWQATLVTQ